jgi:hypothetical protein
MSAQAQAQAQEQAQEQHQDQHQDQQQELEQEQHRELDQDQAQEQELDQEQHQEQHQDRAQDQQEFVNCGDCMWCWQQEIDHPDTDRFCRERGITSCMYPIFKNKMKNVMSNDFIVVNGKYDRAESTDFVPTGGFYDSDIDDEVLMMTKVLQLDNFGGNGAAAGK